MKLARGMLVLLAMMLAATACTSEPGPEPTLTPTPTLTASPSPSATEPESPTPSPEPDPTPSPTAFQSFPPPPQGETEEQAAIRQGWEAYNHTLDKFLRDPSLTDLTETQYVTTGEEQNRIMDEIALTREANIHIGGHQLFRDVTFGEVVEIDGVRQATISYCFDPAHQVVFDSANNQPVADSGAETFLVHDRMMLRPDSSWRVAEHRTEDVRC